MIQALPPILFYDEDKDIQVYEDEKPDPIFKRNFIQKFAQTKLARYTNSFYQQAYKVIFENFKPELDYISDFVIGEKPKKVLPPTYIIDDTDEDEEISEEIDEDEEEFGILDTIKGIWKLSKIYRMYKRIKWAIEKFKDAVKWIRKQFQKVRRAYRWGKRKVIRWIIKAKRFYRKTVRPWLRRLKRRARKRLRKLKKQIGKLLKKLKKVVKKLLRRVKKKLGKIVKKFLKKFGKKLLKKILQQALKWIAGLFTGTGIGAVIGVAIFAAVVAWEAYDFAQDFAGEVSTEPNYPPQTLEKEAKPTTQPEKVKEIKIPNPKDVKEISETQIKEYQNNIVDKVTQEIARIGGLPYRIFATQYEFYKHCRVWLENKQKFINKLIQTMAEGTDTFLRKIVGWMNEQIVTEFKDIVPSKPKDPNKVKKPKFTSMEKIMEVQKLIEKKEKVSGWALFKNGVYVHKKYERTSNVDVRKRKARDLLASVLAGKLPINISTLDPKVKIIKLDKEIKGFTDIRREKIGLLGVKNHLLYELYSRLVWIKETAPS